MRSRLVKADKNYHEIDIESISRSINKNFTSDLVSKYVKEENLSEFVNMVNREVEKTFNSVFEQSIEISLKENGYENNTTEFDAGQYNEIKDKLRTKMIDEIKDMLIERIEDEIMHNDD